MRTTKYRGHTYFGKIVPASELIAKWYDDSEEIFATNGPQGSEAIELLEKLIPLSNECVVDVDDGRADTIFVEVKEDKMKQFMLIMMAERPHEFSEGEKNVFRIWWD